VIQASGTVLACGEGSYGRLGQGNSDDLHSLTIISALQGRVTSEILVYFVCSNVQLEKNPGGSLLGTSGGPA